MPLLPESQQVFLGLGSNIEPKSNYLRQALRLLNQHADCQILQRSSLYQSQALNLATTSPHQSSFLNGVIQISTNLTPTQLLSYCKHIEQELGRDFSAARWSARTVDIDIILFQHLEMSSHELQIPHPELCKRNFVLTPLLEIAPDIKLPNGSSIQHIFNALQPHGWIEPSVELW